MKTLVKFAAILVAGLAFSHINANAGIISGVHQYQDVNGQTREVNLQGLEWLSFDHSFNISRNSIDGKGWTDNQGNQWNANEWRYATFDETSNLLASLWGGNFTDTAFNNYQGASWFDQNFGLNSLSSSFYEGLQVAWFNYGQADECGDANTSCSHRIFLADDLQDLDIVWNDVDINGNTRVVYDGSSRILNTDGSTRRAFLGLGNIYGRAGGYSVVNNGNVELAGTSSVTGRSLNRANLLVRNVAEVPEPAPITLMALSLVGLAFLRKRKVI